MTPDSPTPVRFVDAFRFWLKLGFISFGGPAGQIAVMHQELVERRRWISEKRFLHALNYCMLLPGPEAQQLVTYIGWLLHKRWGGIVAGSLFVLPSLLIIIGLAWVYVAYGHQPLVAAVLAGIKPAVVAIVVQAVHRIGGRTLRHPALWGIAGASFVAIFVWDVPFPWIVGCAALLGWLGSQRWPQVFQTQGAHGRASDGTVAHAPAVIDDDTPTPTHAQFTWLRLLQVLLGGVLLWALPLGFCALLWGLENSFVQMGWFFTKAALLTFGGAYAVLPYVYQGAVQHFGWLNATQMMDGLALGETTPGPLIMVVTFVGFLGGYQQQWLGPEHVVQAGAMAACWATWFTFLPSFVFILAGGPIVERTHGQLSLTAPLTAITAAVVGVVFNLAVFFGWHVGWPQGWEGALDLPAAALTAAALVALLYFKRTVIEVIFGCALLSVVVQLGLAAVDALPLAIACSIISATS
jgi:chromate transporter